MSEEIELIEQARQAGQAYIDSFGGDLDAVVANLNRRSAEAGRRVVSLPPRPPFSVHVGPTDNQAPTERKAG